MSQAPKQFIEEDLEPKGQQDRAAVALLLRFAKAQPLRYLLSLASLLCAACCAVAAGRLLGVFVQDGLMAKDPTKSFYFGCVLLLLEFLALVFSFAGKRSLAVAASFTVLDIRKALFEHLTFLPMAYFDRQPQGRIVTRLTNDVEGLEDLFTTSLGRLVVACFVLVVCVVAMLLTDWRLGLMLTFAMLPAAIFTYYARVPARNYNRLYSRRNSAINARFSEYLQGISVLRAFGLEKWSAQEIDQLVDSHYDSCIRTNYFFAKFRPILALLCMLPLLLLLYFGGSRVLTGTLELGILISFVRYAERFANPVLELSQEIQVIQQGFTSAERVMVLLDSATEDQVFKVANANSEAKPVQNLINQVCQGEVSYQAVGMNYIPGQVALHNINFNILPGMRVGLAGKTGSGKTTTVSLLARLYDFQDGTILLDGHDIRTLDRTWLRSQLGFVSQDVVLFQGSLRENLCVGAKFTDQEIWQACQTTGLSKIISANLIRLDKKAESKADQIPANLEEIMNQHILESGSNLSVGQRQLLAITRVLLKNPAILILDEATSNIDPYHEQLVHKAINRIMQGRTCLIIAHRLETLWDCDLILVFNQGTVVEQGRHDELFKRGGYYTSLVEKAGLGLRVA